MGKVGTKGADGPNPNGTSGNESGIGKGAQANGESAASDAGTGSGSGTGTDSGKSNATGTGKTRDTGAASDNATVNPADIGQDNFERDDSGNVILGVNGKPKKKRGRKPGQKVAVKGAPNSSAKAKEKFNGVEMLAAQFQILNAGISYMTRFDDFRLDDDEAMDMANATAQVMSQFDYTPDPKVTAVMGLVTTTGMIYGPRIYLYRQELKKKAEKSASENIAKADERAAMPPYNLGQFSG